MTSSFKRNQRPATNHSNDNLTPRRVQRTEDYTNHRFWRQFTNFQIKLLPVPTHCKIRGN